MHAAFSVQAMHAPALQTWFVPQEVPGGRFAAESMQARVPVVQLVTPTLHAVGFMLHAAPAAQATQLPALHTRSVPQLVPAGVLAVEFTHVWVPVAQLVTPALQRLGLVEQALPAVHETQAPARQTWLVPQPVPSGVFAAESTQVWTPVAQLVTPCLQRVGFVVHGSPARQAAHWPALHTRSVPQVVPAGAFVEESTQLAAPVAQLRTPTLQTWGFALQAIPATHATQAPMASHT